MTPILPLTRKAFDKAWPAFQSWLVQNGSAIHRPTNSYEVARFLTERGMGVVYANNADNITTWTNGADAAFKAFRLGKSWRARESSGRSKSRRKRLALFNSLVARDGAGCMYCGIELNDLTATIEHIVSATHGGPDHLANMALACRPCNQAAGHLSAREKVEMVVRMRTERQALPEVSP